MEESRIQSKNGPGLVGRSNAFVQASRCLEQVATALLEGLVRYITALGLSLIAALNRTRVEVLRRASLCFVTKVRINATPRLFDS